jgi:hypothetical protein
MKTKHDVVEWNQICDSELLGFQTLSINQYSKN